MIEVLTPPTQANVATQKYLTPRSTKPGPTTLRELSEALRDPLPKQPRTTPVHTNALEAMNAWKPLTLEMVRESMSKERAARDVLLAEYAERTGQYVDYCDECNLGVVEEEHERGFETIVTPVPCPECDGLGVVEI